MRVSLVLLWFCVSGVQLQRPNDQLALEDVQSGWNRLQNDSHVEISELDTDQDSVQADVWAELKELRDMVVEQRVILQFSQRQIKELKTENAVITNRLLVSEIQMEKLKKDNSDIKNRLLVSENQVEELKAENSPLEGRVVSTELGVNALREENTNLNNRLLASERRVEELKVENSAINNRLLVSENQVEQLQRVVSDAPKVAFSFASGLNGYYGPFSSDVILVFSKQITNIGNAYSPVSGVFTAPLRGVYYFRFSLFGLNTYEMVSAFLFKNQEFIFFVSELPEGSHEYISNGVTLLLEEGDLVYVKLRFERQVYDDDNNHSIFSGFLLFPL